MAPRSRKGTIVMKKPKAVRILNGLGAVFPEFRATPVQAFTFFCPPQCHSGYLRCVNQCGGNHACIVHCASEFSTCCSG